MKTPVEKGGRLAGRSAVAPKGGRRRRGWGRRLLRALVLVVVGCLALTVTAALVAWLWWLPEPGPERRSSGVNALWASHTWVGESHSEAEYRQLAERLRSAEISDVFFHSGPLDASGRVRPDRVAYADDLVAALQRWAPGVRAQAYLGQVERRGGGPLDLDDPAVVRNIVATAGSFLARGFGGIHFDIEPIYPVTLPFWSCWSAPGS